MPNEPVDVLIAGTPSAEGPLAEEVERWLDTSPLPVDEAEVDAVVARLLARRRSPHRAVWPAVVLVALAAVALLVARAVPEAVPTDVPAPPTPVQLVATPPDPGLLLVPQRTTVHLEGTEWVVRDPDGEVVVRFPDGEAPPPVDPQRVDTDVLHEELRRAREESLPDRTLRRLETLLEKP